MADGIETYDFNQLEAAAKRLLDAGRYRDARAIYLFMSDGDPSLDGGYLAARIGKCCELENDLHSARYWYGRAVDENPGIDAYKDQRSRLEHVTIGDLVHAGQSDALQKIVRRVPVGPDSTGDLIGLIDLISFELKLGDGDNSLSARLIEIAHDLQRSGSVENAKALAGMSERLTRIERLLSEG